MQRVTSELERRFVAQALSNRHNRAILDAWNSLDLDDGWLVAGCLFQTVWNLQVGRAAEEGIKDYDVFYFDESDVSVEGEAAVQQRVDAALRSLGVAIEVKNQARVHLWYEDCFGFEYPRLANTKEGIDRFLIPATCVGLRPDGNGTCELYAPNGLDALYAGILSPNPLTPHLDLYRLKAASYRQRWNWLQIVEDA